MMVVCEKEFLGKLSFLLRQVLVQVLVQALVQALVQGLGYV